MSGVVYIKILVTTEVCNVVSRKSAWVSLLSLVGVFVPYFVVVFQHPLAFVGLLAGAVIVLVVLLTGFHLVNAVATASIRKRGDVPPQDELDQLIDLRAARVAGVVLAFVVVAWFLIVAFGAPILGTNGNVSSIGLDPSAASSLVTISVWQALIAVHALFAGFVISNLVYYGAIIAGYRKLMDG